MQASAVACVNLPWVGTGTSSARPRCRRRSRVARCRLATSRPSSGGSTTTSGRWTVGICDRRWGNPSCARWVVAVVAMAVWLLRWVMTGRGGGGPPGGGGAPRRGGGGGGSRGGGGPPGGGGRSAPWVGDGRSAGGDGARAVRDPGAGSDEQQQRGDRAAD